MYSTYISHRLIVYQSSSIHSSRLHVHTMTAICKLIGILAISLEHCIHDWDTSKTLSEITTYPMGTTTLYNKMKTNLPNNNNYEIKVKHTNSKYFRFCIRHEFPKLIKDNYLLGKVLEKINTHSYSLCTHLYNRI